MSKVYTTLKLMNGDTVSIDEVTGATYMQAALMCGHERVNNSIIMGMYMLAVAVKKDNQCVGIKYIESLLTEDLALLSEAVGSQGLNIKGNG